jgi:hypothetical protein
MNPIPITPAVLEAAGWQSTRDGYWHLPLSRPGNWQVSHYAPGSVFPDGRYDPSGRWFVSIRTPDGLAVNGPVTCLNQLVELLAVMTRAYRKED